MNAVAKAMMTYHSYISTSVMPVHMVLLNVDDFSFLVCAFLFAGFSLEFTSELFLLWSLLYFLFNFCVAVSGCSYSIFCDSFGIEPNTVPTLNSFCFVWKSCKMCKLSRVSCPCLCIVVQIFISSFRAVWKIKNVCIAVYYLNTHIITMCTHVGHVCVCAMCMLEWAKSLLLPRHLWMMFSLVALITPFNIQMIVISGGWKAIFQYSMTTEGWNNWQ